jgi:hypothetical protein
VIVSTSRTVELQRTSARVSLRSFIIYQYTYPLTVEFFTAWAVYPLPPFQNATAGSTLIVYAAPSLSPAYPSFGTTPLAGDFLVSETTKPSVATVSPPSTKIDIGGPDPTFTPNKRAASNQHHVEDSASSATATISLPITTDVFETSKPGPIIPAGPGRRQLTKV